jgi:hypothetical protein
MFCADIKFVICAKYRENSLNTILNKVFWTLKIIKKIFVPQIFLIMRVSSKHPSDSSFLPIGINATTTVGIVYPKIGFDGFFRLAIAMTVSQFCLSWKLTLLFASTVEEYNRVNLMYSKMASKQPFLRGGAETVYRDEEVITHKNNLPCDSIVKISSDVPCTWIRLSEGVVLKPEQPFEDDKHYIRVVFNQYKTHGMWKDSKITLPCTFDDGKVFPFCYLNDKALLSCVLLVGGKIQVEYFPDIFNGKRKYCFHLDQECKETPIGTTDGKWIAVVNGNRGVIVFSMEDISQCFQFTVENDCISALKIKDDQLLIGTFVGRYYRMHIPTGTCLKKETLLEPIAIVGIEYVDMHILIQTISSVQYMEQPSAVILDRPLCSTLLPNGNIILLNEFGFTRIISDKTPELLLKPPKVIQCDPLTITPWYQNGIYCEEGKGLYVLMPNGMVVTYPW